MITAGTKHSTLLVTILIFVLTSALATFGADRQETTAAGSPKVVSVTQISHDGVSKANLLSDDTSLYVTESPATGHVVARLSLPSADRTVIPTAFQSVQALDISPDRTRLLVSPTRGGTGDSEFWTVPVRAGSPKRLGRLMGRDASWSADGLRVVFTKGSTLYIAKSDGTGDRALFTAPGSVFAPRFSPDGGRIRFSVGDTAQNTTSLWEVGSDGSHPHALLGNWQGGSNGCCGSWTADGRYYIFQVTQSVPTTFTTLWALADSPGASAPVQLTTGPMSFGNAFPGRDNKNIWAIGVRPEGEAVSYNATTNSFAPLVSGASATDLDYSPDGKWIAYVTVPDATLWRCRADGSERLQLTSAPERAALPRWSPDGSQIAYVRIEPGRPSKISLISPSGGVPQDILAEDRSQIDANWSSDGRRIMFGYFLHDSQPIDIRVINLQTHEAVAVPGSTGLFSPRWSPNGKYIAALSADLTKVMLYDFDSKAWSAWFSEPAGAVNYPMWSADSKYLYFDDLVTEEESIRQVKVGEHVAQLVFKLNGIQRYLGPYGLWSGRTADGSWMFVRDRSTQEVYQLSVVLP